jgi:hypothetical protein
MANIFETARAEHQYNKFVSGIASLASLVDTLSGPGPFTIFVPSDATCLIASSSKHSGGSDSACGRISQWFRWERKKPIYLTMH